MLFCLCLPFLPQRRWKCVRMRPSRDHSIVICCSKYIRLSIQVQEDHVQLAGSSWWHCSQDTLSSPSLGWSKSVPHSGQNKSDPNNQDVDFRLSNESNADLFYRQRSCKAIIWMNIEWILQCEPHVACSHTIFVWLCVTLTKNKYKINTRRILLPIWNWKSPIPQHAYCRLPFLAFRFHASQHLLSPLLLDRCPRFDKPQSCIPCMHLADIFRLSKDSELTDWWLSRVDLLFRWSLHRHLASNPFLRITHFDSDPWGVAYNLRVYITTWEPNLLRQIFLNSVIMPKILVPAEDHTHTIGKTERTWKEVVKK